MPSGRELITDTNMFLTKEDLKNNIYSYQVEQITEGDDAIVLQALDTAEQEVKSYFYTNDKKEYLDGRPRYDVEAIFAKRGEERNALVVSLCLSVAKWYIVDLCNADIIYDHAKERYDRAIEYLKRLAKGEVNISSLPIMPRTEESQQQTTPFLFGSRKKFNHE
nr:MAG TPA: head to tail adaptor [Caudoviricetes sp.]